eukprot:2348997-Alexandrium_andersonii.AAC.1
MRDLGAQLNCTKVWGIGLQAERFQKATSIAKDLARLRAPLRVVCNIIRGKILPTALYAVSVSHVPTHSINALQSAIASAILGSVCTLRSPEL